MSRDPDPSAEWSLDRIADQLERIADALEVRNAPQSMTDLPQYTDDLAVEIGHAYAEVERQVGPEFKPAPLDLARRLALIARQPSGPATPR